MTAPSLAEASWHYAAWVSFDLRLLLFVALLAALVSAGITALAAMAILPAGWHILAGAVAGGLVGVVVDARR